MYIRYFTLFVIGLLFSIIFQTCRDKDDQKPSNIISAEIRGTGQKGPFLIGSSVSIQELNESFSPNGTSFEVSTSDNLGSFSLKSDISTPYIEIICTGFYFNEVTGQNTNTNLTLRTISDVSEQLSANINILTTLAKKRIIYLITQEKLSYSAAKTQAESEVLKIFNTTLQNRIEFEDMDLSKEGEANAVLLAISAILQGNNTVSDLSLLINTIIVDIETDGFLDDQAAKAKITENALNLSIPDVSNNLKAKYEELGAAVNLSDFEPFISQVWKNNPPEVKILSPIHLDSVSYGSTFDINISATDSDGKISTIAVYLNDQYINDSLNFRHEILDTATAQILKVVATDDDNATATDSITVYVKPNQAPLVNITSPSDQQYVDYKSEINIVAEWNDPDGTAKKVLFHLNDSIIYQSDFINNSFTESIHKIIYSAAATQTIKVEVIDHLGNVGVDSVQININPGMSWESFATTPFSSGVPSAIVNDGTRLFFLENGETNIYTSTDGVSLTHSHTVSPGYSNYLVNGLYNGKTWLIQNESVSGDMLLWSTTDGTSWGSQSITGAMPYVHDIIAFRDSLYLIDANKDLYVLKDTIWAQKTTNTPWKSSSTVENLKLATYGNRLILFEQNISTNTRSVWSTTDLKTWDQTNINLANAGDFQYQLVYYKNATWLFVGMDSFNSTDGINWKSQHSKDPIGGSRLIDFQSEVLRYDAQSSAILKLFTFGI